MLEDVVRQGAGRGKHRSRWSLGAHGSRPLPLVRLLLYYLIVAAVMGGLAWLFPVARHAFVSPIEVAAVSQAEGLLTGAAPDQGPAATERALSLEHTAERSLTTLLVVMAALALALPVAWVYMHTKRLRYDASLVQSVIILPVVVAGILMIVKASLALAFALGGIVGAVRFRNTLKDPKDLVYIFLASGLGIAASVQALDIALVLSLTFNLTVLALWKFNVGAIYSREDGPQGILTVGNRRLLTSQDPDARRQLQERLADEAAEIKADGVLIVHTADPEPARHAVEMSLSESAKEWKLVESEPRTGGLTTLRFLMKLKKQSTVMDLLGELDDRWAAQVVAAEFVPLTAPAKEADQDADDQG